MKQLRDYALLACLTVCSLLCGAWLRAPAHTPEPQVTRPATWISKATYWLALWRLAHGAPQTPPDRRELPDAVVNARPAVKLDAEGQPLIDHSAGW